MKKGFLILVSAAVAAMITLPMQAQSNVKVQEVQKEKAQQAQQMQQGQANPVVSGAQQVNPAVQKNQANPVVTGNNGQPQQVVQTPPAAPAPLTCTWDVTDYDFGKTVIQGKPASASFNITNAGKEPVTITLVQPSCGCTSPKYTKEPIKPGESGEVVLTYDAKISGYFSKSAQVKLNDGQKYVLTIKGEVQKADQ